MSDVDDNNRTPDYRKKLQDKARIEALLSEREGYKRRDMKDRLSDVDTELKALGYREEKDDKQETTRVAPKTERAGYEAKRTS